MQKMSKKAGLAKKIAHTLMAMSIVYSSGINIVINEAYAEERIENITSGGTKEFEKTRVDGQDYNDSNPSDPITSGADAILTGKIMDEDVSSGEIRVLANGGRGGNDYIYGPQLQQGTNGGTAVAKITVDENLDSITTGNITVSAYSGGHGSAYQGVSGVHGAAAAYGLEVKHDLTITAADIFVSAKAGEGGINTSAVDIDAAKGNDVVAVGLQADNSTVVFEGTKLKIEAINKGINTRDVETAGKEKLSAGGNTEAYGIRVNGGEVTAKLTGDLLIMSALSADGGGSTYDSGSGSVHSNYGSAAGGDGGYAVACGIEVNGGIAHLDLQNIITTDSSTFASSYFSGGAGADGAMADNGYGASGDGGKGGNIAVTGVHVDSGEVDGSIGAINLDVNKSNANGGNGGKGKDGVGNCGSGGDAGAVYAAGVRVDGGEAELTVASIDIKAAAGSGGKIGLIEITDASNITATGTVQAAGGKGGTVLAVGVDNRGGSSKVTAPGTPGTGDIKIAATGGTGGTAVMGEIANVTGDASAILAAERASGAGGEATAVGLQNTAGSLTAAVQKLEITATGGKGGAGLSTYGAVNGVGAKGGAAAAYGINVLGGLAENLTAAEITVQATGGTSEYPNESANYKGCVNADGAGVTGISGGDGGTGAAYGVSNSGGSVGVTVTKITAEAAGGAGAKGGSVAYRSGTPAGIGGDGGNGGNAYAYGVYGSGAASVTAVTADEIAASATAGAAGAGAAVEYGVATAGQSGSKGEEAKAYGVYAAGGAVIELSAKTGGSALKINAQAADGAVTNEACAVYADNATVLFGSKAELNWDGSTGTDDGVVTGLNNATLGFNGTAANRTVTGGKLQLTGSNAFRFTTDLANNKADSMTFDTIENNGSKQYIQIGYEEAFKNALSEADIVTVNGSATVLTITNLNNFVGQASSLDSPLERFKVTPKVEASGNEVKITEVALAKEDTPSETAMTLSDAQMALGSMWRIEGNNLMKRMGDLRNDKEAAQGGVWARYYRGELSADSAYDRNFSQDYTAFQGGIDKVQDYKGGKLYTGIAVNRIDSNAGYTAGSGDLSSTGVGLYASWLGGKGHYLDVIARGSKLTNDFKLVDLSGNAAKADYDTWAYGISAEYGYRQNLQAGWFVEPQAELSLGHLGSADYTTSNGISVKQDSVNSAVVRLGFLGGKEFTIGGRPSNAYVKASLLHDFGGNGGATGYYENSSLALKTGDMTGTWYEIGLGANLGIAKNSNLYFDALKTFNGSIRTDWQFNAGLRFTF